MFLTGQQRGDPHLGTAKASRQASPSALGVLLWRGMPPRTRPSLEAPAWAARLPESTPEAAMSSSSTLEHACKGEASALALPRLGLGGLPLRLPWLG